MGGLTLLAFILRVVQLDFQPLWWDEGYSVWFATHPLGQMAALTAQDIHPPLYYALLHGWIGLWGAGAINLRLLSVVFGVLAIPAIYWAGRRMLGRRSAFLAALLLAINPLHIYYSQEVRMYGLVALLSIGVLAAGWEAMRQIADCQLQIANHPITLSPRHLVTPSLVAYVLFTTAALYTQYYAVFLPIGLTLYAGWRWLLSVAPVERAPGERAVAPPERKNVRSDDRAASLWDFDRRPSPEATEVAPTNGQLSALVRTRPRPMNSFARWLIAQAAAALFYLPWVLYAAPKLTLYVSQKVVQDADRPLGILEYGARHLAAFLVGHLSGPLATCWPLAPLLLLPFGIGFWRLFRRRTGATTQAKPASAHPVTLSPCHRVTLSPCHLATLSPCHLLTVVTLIALALGWLIGLRYPFFPEHGERLLLLALPAFILLLAAGLDALGRRIKFGILALLVAASSASLAAFYTVPRYGGDDYRPLIARTVEQGLPDDTVFAVYPWQVGYWRSYGSRDGPIARLTPDADWTPNVAAALDDALARGKVWFPAHLALGATLETRIEKHLAGRAAPFINEWYGPGTRLSGWAVAPALQAVDAPAVRFLLRGADGAAELLGVEAARQPIAAANAVTPLTLRWRVPAGAPTLRVAVSVRLVDSIGRIWAQHDYEPLGIANCELRIANSPAEQDTSGAIRNPKSEIRNPSDCLSLLIPAGTPPGQYFVDVALHPKGDGRPLDVQAQDGRSLGAAARLFELTVAPADRDLGPERLPIGIRRPQDFADGLRLLGHTLDDRPAAPGEARPVNLFWQAIGQPQADYIAFVQLLDGAGQLASLWEAPPGGAYATAAWQPGALIRTQAAFRPRADLLDGRYRLIAGLFRAGDKVRLKTVAGADHILLGEVTVRGRPHDRTRPQPKHAADVAFGPVGRLIGYDLAPPADGFRPGATIPLTLYWQASAATERPYTVFVHLVDAAGAIWGYGDGEPGGGKLPTTSWRAGEYLTDAHQVSVAAGAPAGVYRLRIGLYDPTTGERLVTPEGKDYVEISQPPIVVGG